MKKCIPFIVVICFSLVSLSCPSLLSQNRWPIEITNFPEWMMREQSHPAMTGLSPWMDWQEGEHPIAVLLSPQEKANKEGFDGFFRISSVGFENEGVGYFQWSEHQTWQILFSDGSGYTFLFWLGKSDYYGREKEIPQPDPNVFEFDAQIYNNDYGSVGGGNLPGDGSLPADEPVIMAKVRYEFIEETTEYRRYQFQLTRNNETVILETEMKSLLMPWFEGNNRPTWLAKQYKTSNTTENSSPYDVYLNGNDKVVHIAGNLTSKDRGVDTYFTDIGTYYTALSQEEVDNQEKRVLYGVHGAPPDSDNLHYIEVHRNARETAVFRFMNANKEVLEEGTGWIFHQEDLDAW